MEAYTIKDNKTSIKATEKISGSEAIVRCLIEEGCKNNLWISWWSNYACI